MKQVLTFTLIVCLCGCADTTDNSNLTNSDSIALDAMDSSAIMNDSTRLSADSTKTGVTH